jgi:hypothetical protein
MADVCVSAPNLAARIREPYPPFVFIHDVDKALTAFREKPAVRWFDGLTMPWIKLFPCSAALRYLTTVATQRPDCCVAIASLKEEVS